MHIRKTVFPLAAAIAATVLLLSSCGTKQVFFDYYGTVGNTEPTVVLNSQVGGQNYEQKFFNEPLKFSEAYPDLEFGKIEIECLNDYDTPSTIVAGNYIYIQRRPTETLNLFSRYNMETGTEEELFTYETEYGIGFSAANDKYIIWCESEDINEHRYSSHYYDIENGVHKKYRTIHSISWSNDVLDGNCVYFDETVGWENGKANINLYEYNLEKDELNLIAENRAANPVPYKGLSWLSFDETSEEYVLQNIKSSKTISFGKEYFAFNASENIIVGYTYWDTQSGVAYFDGRKAKPIYIGNTNIDNAESSDKFISWNNYIAADPMYYDIDKNKVVIVDVLEPGHQYPGKITEKYIAFHALDYIDAPEIPGGKKVRASIYYFIKTSELK